jgi:ribosomal protein L37AE/L43A
MEALVVGDYTARVIRTLEMMMSLGNMRVVVCVKCKNASVEVIPGTWSCGNCNHDNEEQTRGLSLVESD